MKHFIRRLLSSWRPTQSRYRRSAVHRLFESLEARCLLAADFGDAPVPYPVTIAEGGADEDGVTLGSLIRVGQLDAMVTVNVSAAAKLDARIDFNGDGSWGGPGEQIFDSIDVVGGDTIEAELREYAFPS